MTTQFNRRKFVVYGAGAIATSMGLKACASPSAPPAATGPAASPTTAASPGLKDFKVAIALPGPITDKAWNTAGYSGLEAVKSKLNVETAYQEKVKDADQAEVLADFARRGFSVVYAHGGQFDAAIKQVAPQFPKTFFVGVNGAATGSNIAALRLDNLQASYLCGMIGASLSKSNKMAYLAGQEFLATQEELRGFQLGAKAIKPDIAVSSTFVGDWNDVAKAKEAVLALISTGADVVYQWLDNSAPTVLQTAQEKGVYTFGNTVEQFDIAPKSVLTTPIKRIDLAIAFLADLASKGELKGEIYNLGLDKSDILYLGKMNPTIPSEVMDKVKKAQDAILAKKLTFESCTEGGKETRCAKGAA
jgi:basic membrane protein A and related proteins